MPTARMETARIAALLAPYLGSEGLTPAQLGQLSKYIDLLLKWNARMNLTSVREPEQIVTRHFGESLFTARHLFPLADSVATLGDVGSGAGFPGLPIAIARPQVRATLIEAHGKKSVFLKEVVRGLGLANVTVVATRAEKCVERFDVVTFRADLRKPKQSRGLLARNGQFTRMFTFLIPPSDCCGLHRGNDQVLASPNST